MRWQNTETPTFAGSAGSAGEPAIVETMQLLDHDGNEVAAFTKAVDGTIASTVDGQPKVYRALLTQTGTDAPVATVLENTLGGTPVWTYQGVGIYRALLTDAFPENTTTVFTGDRRGSTASVPSTQLFRRHDFELQLEVGDYNIVYNDPNWELEWAGGDDLLLSFPVMVIVNP